MTRRPGIPTTPSSSDAGASIQVIAGDDTLEPREIPTRLKLDGNRVALASQTAEGMEREEPGVD
jgi:hypothetical protein